MNGITTHILDTSRGVPAPHVLVRLERDGAQGWQTMSETQTDADGRARLGNENPEAGHYRLTFEVAAYFDLIQSPAFYPTIQVTFIVREKQHHHVPLLLNAFGFSTYRGS